VTAEHALRPLERRVLRLVRAGVGEAEIARRFRRRPDTIRRVIELADMPRSSPATSTRDDVLRPLERRVLRWRHDGAEPAEIAPRFKRGPAFIEQVERLAEYKLARA
jgi:DNA-binding CsgD family transcriptional regulator